MDKRGEDISPRLEAVCRAVSDAVSGSYWTKRFAVAARFGYMDAAYMRHMHETLGYSISDQVIHLRRRNVDLAIPWLGLRNEFLAVGMRSSAVVSMLNEAREFDKSGTTQYGR